MRGILIEHVLGRSGFSSDVTRLLRIGSIAPGSQLAVSPFGRCRFPYDSTPMRPHLRHSLHSILAASHLRPPDPRPAVFPCNPCYFVVKTVSG